MAYRFNPFAFLFETNNWPHARTLRSSLTTKLADAARVIMGEYTHAGLFDYATLFIPASIQILYYWCKQEKLNLFSSPEVKLLAESFYYPLGFLNVVGSGLRHLVGYTLTALTSPITLLVHGVSRLVDGTGMEDALDVQGTYNNRSMTLRRYVGDSNIDELTAEVKKTQKGYEVSLKIPSYQSQERLTVEIKDTRTAQSQPNIYALFSHNIGGAATYVELNAANPLNKDSSQFAELENAIRP